jgi:enamine deaminase RidA (YjgF/YER057c/UK114 family)
MRREAIHCPKVPRPVMGSHAVKAGDFVFLGGQIPSDYKNGLAPEVKNNSRGVSNPVDLSKIQSDYILKNARAILKSAGSSFKNGVRIDQFVTRPEAASPYLDTRKRFVPPSIRPASTHVAIESLAVPDALVGLELIAITDAGAARKRIIDMEGVPKSPGGPFAGGPQAVAAGDFIFLTGQIASDFKTGIVPEARKDPGFWYGSAIGLQTEYVLKRLQMVLEEAESSLEHVVKADVWLMDMEDVREFDEVWKEYFPKNPPARSLLPVSRIADAECLIEINLIAVREGGKAKTKKSKKKK